MDVRWIVTALSTIATILPIIAGISAWTRFTKWRRDDDEWRGRQTASVTYNVVQAGIGRALDPRPVRPQPRAEIALGVFALLFAFAATLVATWCSVS